MHHNCECDAPGYCPRYRRGVYGRDWEICRGQNVDLGTAALWRQLWEQDGRKRPLPPDGARAIIIRDGSPPGDVLCTTAAVRSLHLAHPGKFLVAADTRHGELFERNPDFATLKLVEEELHGAIVDMHHPAVNESNARAIHYLQSHCEHLEWALGVKVPLLVNRPIICLSDLERAASWPKNFAGLESGKYWLVCSGVKSDFTAKGWGREAYQKTVDLCLGRARFVQVGATADEHPALGNVLDLVGRTSLRQLTVLAHHAAGGLGGVSLLMHLMAAVERPYACIAGGREPVVWNQYPLQHTFHAVGLLPCCARGACWKSRTVPLGDGNRHDESLCEHPVLGDEPRPLCMAAISPEEVAERILRISA